MTEAEYMADVQKRGGFYARSLFAGSWPLRDTVVGFPGAGFPDASSPVRARYELAPFSVAAHVVGLQSIVIYPWDQSSVVQDAAAKAAGEAKTLVQSTLGQVPNVLGNVLGLPPFAVTLIVLFLVYAALRQVGVVPALGRVARD